MRVRQSGGGVPCQYRLSRSAAPMLEGLESRTLLAAGLLGTYFTNSTLSGTPIFTRADSPGGLGGRFDINYGLAGPAGMPSGDNFSVRWTGQFTAPQTNTYTFFVGSDDGARLFLNNQQNTPAASWQPSHVYTEYAGTPVSLTAGQKVPITLEFYEVVQNARINLMYQTPQQFKQSVPNTQLSAPPQVTFAEFDGPTATYTPKSHLVVRFSENLSATFGVQDIVIKNLDEGYEITHNSGFGNAFNVNYSTTTNTAVITFPGLLGEQLPSDGNYQLRLRANGITDTAGNQLDGNGDGAGGDDFTHTFYRLTGDTQVDARGAPRPDRKVDFADYQVMARNFGKTNPTPRDGDFNYDGVIDSIDMDILYGLPFDPQYPGMFGATLPPPPAGATAVQAPAPQPAPVLAAPIKAKPVKKVAPPPAKPVVKPAPVSPPRFAAKRIRETGNWLATA